MDDATITAGILLEAAQNNQKIVEASIQKLEALTKVLESLPRTVTPEIKASIEAAHREELAATRHEFHVITKHLQLARQRMARTWLMVGGAIVVIAVLAVTALLLVVLPSPKEIQALRAEKHELAATVADLSARGGRAHLRTCANPGDSPRLCIAVDPAAGTFGNSTERFMVVKGY